MTNVTTIQLHDFSGEANIAVADDLARLVGEGVTVALVVGAFGEPDQIVLSPVAGEVRAYAESLDNRAGVYWPKGMRP